MRPEEVKIIIELLLDRDGVHTLVFLQDGKKLDVYDISYGYDMEDEFAHITINISPGPALEDFAIDLFYTSEISRIIDPVNNELLFEPK